MGQLKHRYPHIAFLLSCDAKEISDEVHAAFPGTIEQPKSYRYDREGIMRSAADLYALEQTDWLIGSNHSSYAQMIALMRGAEYTGSHEKPGGISDGRYEDAWNPPDEEELERQLDAQICP